MEKIFEGQNGSIAIFDDYIEIKRIPLGFQVANSYKSFVQVYTLKFEHIAELRIKQATFFIKGYIQVLTDSEIQQSRNFFKVMKHKYTIIIDSKNLNSEASNFKNMIDELIR